jgi:uncharacterized protein
MDDVDADGVIDSAAEANLRRVRGLFDAVAARDLPAILGCYAPDVMIQEAPSLPYGGVYRGADGAYEHALAFWRTWAAYQPATVESLNPIMFADGCRVVVLWQHEAHDRVSGAHIAHPVVSVYELRDGLVTGARMFHLDTAALLRFLDRAS